MSSSLSDHELSQLGVNELIHRYRKVDRERLGIMLDHSNMMKEVNARMEQHLAEIRSLKDINARLQDDNQELRDLCCFLDDERQKGRKYGREWQKFGRYTSNVMQMEVSAYQEKLTNLEQNQKALMEENYKLKELCLFMEEERVCSGEVMMDRDQGDGSSTSTSSSMPEKGEQNGDRNELYIQQLKEKINRLEMCQAEHHSSQDGLHLSHGDNAILMAPDSSISSFEQVDNLSIENSPDQLNNSHSSSMRLQSDDSLDLLPSLPLPKLHNTYSAKQKGLLMPELKVPLLAVDQLLPFQLAEADSVGNHRKSVRAEFLLNSRKIGEDMRSSSHPEIGNLPLEPSQQAILQQMCNVVWSKLSEDLPSAQIEH